MLEEIDEFIGTIEKLFLKTITAPMGNSGLLAADLAFKVTTVKLLSVIAKQLADLNDKTPDEC